MEGLDFLGADSPIGFRSVEEWCQAIGRGAGSPQCGPGPHRRGPKCPPLTHCTDPVVGAGGMPAFSQLRPYFLTEYPTSGEQLAALYEAYLRAYDGLVNSIESGWHPLTSSAVYMAMQAERKVVTDLWAKGGASSIMAVQMLAGLMGWFNANYVQSDGGVNWQGLSQPVNAAVIEQSQAAAQTVVQAAKDAAKIPAKLLEAASTAWYTTVAMVGGAVLVAGLLGWALIRSGAPAAVARAYLPGRR